MPRFPNVGPAVEGMKGSVFSAIAHRLKQYDGPVYPLHVGDTWLAPAIGSRMQDFSVDEYPDMHRYSDPQGRSDLLDAIVDVKGQQMGCSLDPSHVLVTAGATGGLAAVVGAILSPGDEVMVLAPFWPLIAGIIRSFRGSPVAVPILRQVGLETVEDLVTQLDAHVTPKTVAIYLNTPNNPTGESLPLQWMEAIAEWARGKGIWILADEVYDLYVYEGPHTYMHTLAPERTFSSFSFSKAYGMAGNRCGFVIGPPTVMPYAQKMSTHSFYSTPTASQMAGFAALTTEEGRRWVEHARETYSDLGNWVAKRLGEEQPQGGTFLFVDVQDVLDERGLIHFLENCVDQGLLVAPGPSFGPFPTYVRVCFTSISPDKMKRGVEIFAGLLGR